MKVNECNKCTEINNIFVFCSFNMESKNIVCIYLILKCYVFGLYCITIYDQFYVSFRSTRFSKTFYILLLHENKVITNTFIIEENFIFIYTFFTRVSHYMVS